MPNAFRTPARLFGVVALSLGLACCGTNAPVIICSDSNPPSSNGTCRCGSGTQACPVNPGPEFLYASSFSGQVLAYSIDHSTGALTPLASVTGPSMSIYPMAAVNHQFLYVPDSLHAQLYGFSIDQTTGALTALGGSPFSTGTLSLPEGLASPPGSNLLYAADILRVDGFNVGASGTPTALAQSPFTSVINSFLAADPSGKFLYAWADDPQGGVFAFTIDSTGALTAVPNSPFTVPGQASQNGFLSGIVDTGSYVYVTLWSTNQIAGFSIVSGTGALVPVPNSPFAAGANPNSLVVANGFLYASNLDGTISGYSIDASSGVLTPLANSPFTAAGTSLAVDSFGEYLYANEPGGIEAFKIDSTSGALSQINGSPFPASDPANLAVVQIPPP